MTRRLFLTGAIGCGKSTLIKNSLGAAAKHAGGFVTVRVTEGERLSGFDLLPACSLACEDRRCDSKRFLTFGEGGTVRDDSAFTEDAARMLREAVDKPFAVIDELGGAELALPEFFAALTEFFESSLPCLGVIKSPAAASALKTRVGVPEGWDEAARALRELMGSDKETTVLQTTGRYDTAAENALREWVNEYVGNI